MQSFSIKPQALPERLRPILSLEEQRLLLFVLVLLRTVRFSDKGVGRPIFGSLYAESVVRIAPEPFLSC